MTGDNLLFSKADPVIANRYPAWNFEKNPVLAKLHINYPGGRAVVFQGLMSPGRGKGEMK